MIFALAASAFSAPLRAQPQVLEALREAVVSRWEFQKRVPLSAKVFADKANAAERSALISQLGTGTQSRPGRDALWAEFASGLASELNLAGTGGGALASASNKAKGEMAFHYEAFRILAQAGLHAQARAWQREIHRSMLAKGYTRIPELAKLELRRAGEAIERGDYAAAGLYLEMADKLDPLSPWIPFRRLLLHLREKAPFGQDLGLAWDLAKETLRPLRYYESQSFFLVNLSRILRWGLGLFGAACILLLFARHFHRISHPWAEKLPQTVDLGVRYVAIAMVPIGLVVGGAGFVIAGLLGAMLLWKHCSSGEKSILAAVIMGVGMLPFLVMWEQAMIRHLDPRLGVNLYHEAFLRGYEKPGADRVLAFRPRTVEDSVYRSLASAIRFKKRGDYIRSAALAAEAASLDPSGAFPLLVSGNIAMAGFEYSRAADAYAQARRQAPELVETWFNSSQAELHANNSAQHKRFLDRAAEIDASLVTRWLKDNDANFPAYPATRKAMDPMLRSGGSWRATWLSLRNADFLDVTLRGGILEMRGSWLLIAALAAILGLYLRFRRHTRHSHGRDLFECKICARVMCRTCRKGVHCQNCFKTFAGVHDNRIRLQLIATLRGRAAANAWRIGSALNWMFPGAGNIYLGRGVGRFVWPLAVSLLFGLWYGMNHLLMEYPATALGPLRWLPCLPVILIYAVFNLNRARTQADPESALPSPVVREREAAR